MFLTAVASAVPAERSLQTTALTSVSPSEGRVASKVSQASAVYSAASPATLTGTLRRMAPAAEPVMLIVFGTALVGGARIARRRPVRA